MEDFLFYSPDAGDKYVEHIHACKTEPYVVSTDHQIYTIADTLGYGEALFIDGEIQSTIADEALYHVPFVHGAAALMSASPKRVLVIGGGEGCVARELLKYHTIESILQVDWDVDLVNYFRSSVGIHWNGGAYDDPRVTVVHEDVFKADVIYRGTYDLILVDLCDPNDDTLAMIKTLIVRLFGVLEKGGCLLMNGGAVLPSCLDPYNTNYSVDLVRFMDGVEKPWTGGSVFSYKIYVPSYMEPWCLIGFGGYSTIGDWSKEFIDVRDVRDWMNYEKIYDPFFGSVNSAFHRNSSSRASELSDRICEYGC